MDGQLAVFGQLLQFCLKG